jgi:outer membrane protein assembly factor BamB
MDVETHQPKWQISLGWPVIDAQFVGSKFLVISAGNGYRNLLAGIDQATGQILWSQPNREVVSNFVVADGKVYALTMDSALVPDPPLEDWPHGFSIKRLTPIGGINTGAGG